MPPLREQPDPLTPSLAPVGQHTGQQPLAVGRLITLIGSAPSARLYLPSKAVSRCHAAVINTDGAVFIRDLASRTKTRVNGRSVKEAELSDGDVVQIARFAFRFTRPGPAAPAPPRPPAPAAAFEIDGVDDPVPLETRALLIGRREHADISLTENAASSAHALVLVSEGKHIVRDLNSRTGTFVNGVKVHEHVLSPGDVIRVGETSFRYVRTAAAAREPARPARLPPAAAMAAIEAEAPAPDSHEASPEDDLIHVDVSPELPVEPRIEVEQSAGDAANREDSAGVLELAEAEREGEEPAGAEVPANDVVAPPEADLPSEVEPREAPEPRDAVPSGVAPEPVVEPVEEESPAAPIADKRATIESEQKEQQTEEAATVDDVFEFREPEPEARPEPAGRADFVYEGFDVQPADPSADTVKTPPAPREVDGPEVEVELAPVAEAPRPIPPAPARAAAGAPPPPAPINGVPAPAMKQPAPPPAPAKKAPPAAPPAQKPRRWSAAAAASKPKEPPPQRPARPLSPFDLLGAADDLQPLHPPPPPAPPGPPPSPKDRK